MFRNHLIALALVMTSMTAAQAAGDVPPGVVEVSTDSWHKISSAHADFFYLESVFGTNASVQNDMLTFDTTGLISGSVTSASNGIQIGSSGRYPTIVVVAHDGYAVLNSFGHSMQASGTAPVGGFFAVGMYTRALSQAYPDFMYDDSAADITYSGYNGAPIVTESNHSQHAEISPQHAMYLSATAGGQMWQDGEGTTSASIDRLSYSFTISAVPEPGAYAMLLAGVAFGALVRRRGGLRQRQREV